MYAAVSIYICIYMYVYTVYINIYNIYFCIHTENGTANFRLFSANDNRRLLFQQRPINGEDNTAMLKPLMGVISTRTGTFCAEVQRSKA
jgi:hypothetical protein